MKFPRLNTKSLHLIRLVDEELSNRSISLDPKGYFLIRIDYESSELIVEHFLNNIDELGRATDPITGEPISCNQEKTRGPCKTFRGRTAKELGTKLTEGPLPYPLSKLDHALYLGRELQRAEGCLKDGLPYIQD